MAAPMNEFDLDRTIAESWAGFAVRLAEVVSVMEPGAVLTLSALAAHNGGGSPYVRFSCGEGGTILSEAPVFSLAADREALSVTQRDAMAALGWCPPSSTGPPRAEVFTASGTQEDAAGIAAQAVATLREVYGVPHPAFLAPDQLAEVLTSPSPREAPVHGFPADDLDALMPASLAELDGHVAAELADVLGHEPLRDTDGDFAIRVGTAMVFVRCTSDLREILVFSPLVHEIEGRSRAMEVLSDLNTEARFVKFLLLRDRVFVSLSVPAHPFVPAHLHQALETVSLIADQLDEQLAARLRGRTTFPGPT